MSLDLVVFGPTQPVLTDVLASMSDAGLAVAKHGHGPGGSLVRNEAGAGPRHLCSVDGPFEVDETEDEIPDCVLATLLAVNWTVQISSPGEPTQADATRVRSFAERAAEAARGVVYDPQGDIVLWPRNPKKLRSVTRAGEAANGNVKIELVFSRFIAAKDAVVMLDVLRRHLPEAMPRRFGTYEPLQGRLGRDGEQAFTALFDGSSSVFWNGTTPFGMGHSHSWRGLGSALDPDEREARIPTIAGRKGVTTDSIMLDFRASIGQDSSWLGAIERTFTQLAQELRPFLAGAYFHEAKSRNIISAKYWLGLPQKPALWLAWIASPYLELMPNDLPPVVRTDDHIFIRSAETPMQSTEVAQNQILWDPRLVRGGNQLEEALAAETIPDLRLPL